ncbi:hypothetical protein HELRODRAFT_179738 [Helobdella robusta]|uniref:C-type lectin domain-containing protein n=1 Tax=Helobdella robusta TaxID=6412 RepID=T1FF35_HELRO|nr:hypothetical protein HELRODRAFT_179738 [Helobdella robusta]ESN95142.1 hypothetical protein HELRODRAFT_179738 [Helobdella robusta]
MNKLIICALFSLFLNLTTAANLNCSDKYCLYILDSLYYYYGSIRDSYCSQNGKRNDFGSIEIYDDQNFTTELYISNTTSNKDSQKMLRYFKLDSRFKLSVLCSIKGKYYYYTWYDGHYECLRLGGSLAVLDDLSADEVNQMWVQLALQNGHYWIGLTKALLTWKKSGLAFTYTNWLGSYPYDLIDRPCICLSTYFPNNPIYNNNCSGIYNIICMEG